MLTVPEHIKESVRGKEEPIKGSDVDCVYLEDVMRHVFDTWVSGYLVMNNQKLEELDTLPPPTNDQALDSKGSSF